MSLANTMNILQQKFIPAATVLVAGLLLSDTAAAFRCGSKLVKDGMHEAQVLAACGQPTTMRNVGVAVRGYDYRFHREIGSGWSAYYDPGYPGFAQEVYITEYVYNFGPRKLMRRLLFEGGVLVAIESLGYGYQQ